MRKKKLETLTAAELKLAPAEAKEETYAAALLRRFGKHKLAVIGLVVLVVLSLIAVLAPFVAPYDPYAMNPDFESPPTSDYLLGTDQMGRDVLSRLIYGARVSLTVGIGTVAISMAIGIVLGLFAGYVGGWFDMVVMRITDMFMSFPDIVLILVAVSILGPGLRNIIIVIGLLSWPAVTRLVRGNVLAIKENEFITSARVLGFSTPRIVFGHVLPLVVAPLLVNATSGMASAIITEAALSFLGMGVQDPEASWGNMMSQAQSLTILTEEPWLWLPPGILIMTCVLAINFVGDGIRDAIDPRTRR